MARQVSELPPQKDSARDRKKGFSVGPDNLPDGVHRRKVQKIKQNLIRKAQIQRSYQKIKSREPNLFINSSEHATASNEGTDTPPSASLELHPERKAMLDDPEPNPLPSQLHAADAQRRQRRPRQPRPAPFRKEAEMANQRKEEREARQKAFEEANREREAKREEGERFRKAMTKARTGGRDRDQRKLGRESKVLLEKVQRMMSG